MVSIAEEIKLSYVCKSHIHYWKIVGLLANSIGYEIQVTNVGIHTRGLTCESSETQSSMKKNTADHAGASGSRAKASG